MPKKRLTAVCSPPLIGLKKAAKFRPICRPITSPANSIAAKTIRTEKPSETPISTCCSTAVTPGGGVERDRRHRRDRRLGAERDQEGQADAQAHRHAALGDDRQRAEEGEDAQERPEDRRHPGEDIGLGEGEHGAA